MPEAAPTAPPRAVSERVSKYRGTRRLCDECTRLIHELGAQQAPYPMHASWRAQLEDSSTVLYLCYAHREIRE